MKQNKFFILAAAAALFVACSSDDNYTAKEKASQAPQEVSFGAYLNRSVTRAGCQGDLSTTKLQTFNSKDGFGVFGYYTDSKYYDQTAVANFMYNQPVRYTVGTTSWTYAPVKYWPNEHGSDAISDDIDLVSFFAYAPWVEVDPKTGEVITTSTTTSNPDEKTGIVGIKNNSASGDPIVKYISNFDLTKSVDLLWGVAGSSDYNSWTIEEKDDTQKDLLEGMPWLNVQRPADATESQKLKFTFNHALAKLNVQVDAFVDGTDNTNEVAANNKIFIRSITFTGIPLKAALNLNNTAVGKNKANWMSFNCVSDLEDDCSVTINDGRMNGREGAFPNTNEKNINLNPDLVESTVWSNTGAIPGVTKTPVNLFAGTTSETAPVYVIPSGKNIDVTIVYDVEAADNNLSTLLTDGIQHGSKITNTITKYNVFGTTKLESGKSYTLKLHLGMNSVKFDAIVIDDWDATSDPNANVDLPTNN